jgi:hypothetical protein
MVMEYEKCIKETSKRRLKIHRARLGRRIGMEWILQENYISGKL